MKVANAVNSGFGALFKSKLNNKLSLSIEKPT